MRQKSTYHEDTSTIKSDESSLNNMQK